ncbi:MAG: glycosyltransferase [Lachnospiraceae bacterium]|nr:glycosyltransferase [Lachnospiraceae bacterium]
MNEKKILRCQSKKKALVDIMVLTYNHERYIGQALDSILMQQTDFPYRIVVGEDCSTDNTREIVLDYYERFSDKMEVVLWEKNVGVLQNDLEIMRKCDAKYIASLEGDDYWTDKHKLQKQVFFLESHQNYIGTAHNVRCVDQWGELLHRDFRFYPVCEEHIYGKKQALKHELISQTASLVYRNVYKEWKDSQWEFYLKSNINGDLVGQTFLGMQGDVYFFREIMADHRRSFEGDSWTSKTSGRNMLFYNYVVWKKLDQYLAAQYGVGINTENMWDFLWSEGKRRLLCDFNIKNLKVCCQLLFNK